jgi:phosphatidylinositol alpha-1,6-mannosyltransferase
LHYIKYNFMAKTIVVFTLQTFSTTGGIQKMTRTLAHSLNVLSDRNGWDFEVISVYDAMKDLMPQYLSAERFKGFNGSRIRFMLNVLFSKNKPDVVILSHINLAIVGLIYGILKPKCKIWLIGHGIEVWRPLTWVQRLCIKYCDRIVCVSNFTRQQMISRHNCDPAKCIVLNNAIDPFMKLPTMFKKPERLIKKYRIAPESRVIFTLTRLASTEQYKGHDQVIKVVSRLRTKFPGIKYILAGQYDHKEEIRIQRLISEYKVDEEVILTGFIDEAELSDYFLLADLFVLPSKKEGFGIVFIEARACGLPVICGNVDGSIDAIRDGELGRAVNPEGLAELEEAITEYFETPLPIFKRYELQMQCLLYFNESDYMETLDRLIKDEPGR